MTYEQAAAVLERLAHTEAKWPGTEETLEALDIAAKALHMISAKSRLQHHTADKKHSDCIFS